MRGSMAVRFSSLFADTIGAHGPAWAFNYYTSHGMTEQEFGVWFRGWSGRAWEGVSYYTWG